MQELPQTISCEVFTEPCEAKTAKKGQSKMKPVSTRALAPQATQALLKSKHPHDKQDIQDLITALRSQFSHVKTQTAFLDLKRTEMRPDDQVSLYGFMDAQEQLKIEKSLLAGHVRMLQDMMAEMKLKPDMEIRRLLNEIRNNVEWLGV